MNARITLERTYDAPLDDVWELWTTKEGIESWWGPHGFSIEVHSLELRVNGVLDYSMTAIGREQIAFMQRAGRPNSSRHRVVYTQVIAKKLLEYRTQADFIPGVAPYPMITTVELSQTGGRVTMVLTFDAMHDEMWTQRATMGHEMELQKLDARIKGKSP